MHAEYPIEIFLEFNRLAIGSKAMKAPLEQQCDNVDRRSTVDPRVSISSNEAKLTNRSGIS